MKGKGPSHGLSDPLDVNLPVLVQLRRVAGACWEAAFTDAFVGRPDLPKARPQQLPPP